VPGEFSSECLIQWWEIFKEMSRRGHVTKVETGRILGSQRKRRARKKECSGTENHVCKDPQGTKDTECL
jgi:hypothetical protein